MLNTVNEITDNIIEQYEKKLLDKIINTHYFYFLNYEKMKIVEKALQKLERNDDEAGRLRVDIIREKLEEYLANEPIYANLNFNEGPENIPNACRANIPDGHQQKILEGFVRFRLREYYSILETVVDDAAQEYLIEREYEEFIGLLKYFVDISESKTPALYIFSGDFGYKFLDNDQRDITSECLADFLTPMEEVGYVHSPVLVEQKYVNYDDMLISTLLTLAPSKIFWYNANQNSEIVRTVTQIFGKNIDFY